MRAARAPGRLTSASSAALSERRQALPSSSAASIRLAHIRRYAWAVCGAKGTPRAWK